MAHFVILSQIMPGMFSEKGRFAAAAAEVKQQIARNCPEVEWITSYATAGQYDVVDIVQAESIEQVERAALIIRGRGHSITQTMHATPWDEFIDSLS
ncbi:MAG: GYD domain-containing protein [Phycisphaerae bacterium]